MATGGQPNRGYGFLADRLWFVFWGCAAQPEGDNIAERWQWLHFPWFFTGGMAINARERRC